ncbi:MAG TPA: M56 family metallopeptidase [Pirellulales bacterium]|jgi:beta-lactamase regulating signal transducer with metallopeptidase domain
MMANVAVSLVFKGTLLLLIAWVVDVSFGRRWPLAVSAFWNATLLGLAILPVAVAVVRPVNLPLLAAPVDNSSLMHVADADWTKAGEPFGTRTTANDSSDATVTTHISATAPAPATTPDSPGTAGSLPYRFRLFNAIAAFYGVGCVVVLLRLIGSWQIVALLRRRSHAVTVNEWTARLEYWQIRLFHKPLHRLILLESDEIDIPVVLGIFRPAIVIPRRLAQETSHQLLDTIIVHECAHILRADYAWQFLQRVVEAVWWFHPLVWLARPRIALGRECACDAFAVHALRDGDSYGQELLRMAAGNSTRRALGLGLAVARHSSLARRLHLLSEAQGADHCAASRFTRGVVTAGMVTSVVLSAGLVVGQAPAIAPQRNSTAKAEPEADESQDLTVEDVLARSEAAAQAMTPYDVRITVKLSWLMKTVIVDREKDPEQPNFTKKMEWIPYGPDEEPKSITNRYRQVAARDGARRIETNLDEDELPTGVQRSILVDDGQTQRSISLTQKDRPQASMQRSRSFNLQPGDEYLSYTNHLLARVPIALLARERPHSQLIKDEKPDANLIGLLLPAEDGPSLKQFEFRVWFDRRYGWLPRKIAVYQCKEGVSNLFGAMEVETFHEFAPGKWAPVEMTYTNYNVQPGEFEGKVTSRYRAQVDVDHSRWDQPLDEGVLLLPFAEGSQVVDMVNAQMVTVGKRDDGRNSDSLAKNAKKTVSINTPETMQRQQADLEKVRPQDQEPGRMLRKYGALLKANEEGVITSLDFQGGPSRRRGFGEPDIDDDGLKYVAQLDKLEHLALSNTQITDAGLAQLRGLTSLKELALTNCNITDDGVKQLDTLVNLEWLWLNNNLVRDGKRVRFVKITDEALRLSRPLSKLTHLQLYGTAVTDAGLEYLKDLPNLGQVSLNGSDVTREGARKFRTDHPGPRILLD